MEEKEIEILLVEDNPDDADLALRALRKQDLVHHIEVVHDGVEALEYLFCTGAYAHRNIQNRPKIVLLDIKLPKVDGFEVLQRIKTDPRTQMIPVVMLTSSGQEHDVTECYKLGVNSYVVKPVDFSQFTKIVQHIGSYWLSCNQSPI